MKRKKEMLSSIRGASGMSARLFLFIDVLTKLLEAVCCMGERLDFGVGVRYLHEAMHG
jgi:hypothetical protein